jgi:hypothetical protein
MSRKKAPPRPEARFLSRDPDHCSFIPVEKFGWLSIVVSFSVDGGDAIEFERAASQTGAQGQPWFYPRLVAYGYFWFSEGA